MNKGKNSSVPAGGRSAKAIGILFILLALSVAFAAGTAFLFVYWTSGRNDFLGATMAVALAGLGIALVVWAHRLMPHQEASGTREPLSSGERERLELTEDFVSGANQIERRRILGWMSVVVLGTLAAGFVSLVRSLGKAPLPVLLKPAWTRGERLVAVDGRPVAVDALEPGSIMTVFPEGRIGSVSSQTLLIRVEEGLLRPSPGRADWSPKGNIAFSRICTHAGCPVGQYEKQEHLLLCPCHQSTFNILKAAEPIGGPAARPLPQLPLYADQEGNLRAQGNFSSPQGPGFWEMPS